MCGYCFCYPCICDDDGDDDGDHTRPGGRPAGQFLPGRPAEGERVSPADCLLDTRLPDSFDVDGDGTVTAYVTIYFSLMAQCRCLDCGSRLQLHKDTAAKMGLSLVDSLIWGIGKAVKDWTEGGE